MAGLLRFDRPTCATGHSADEGCSVPCCPAACVQVLFLRPSLIRSRMPAPRPVPLIPNHQIRVVAAGLGARMRPGLDACVGPCHRCGSSPWHHPRRWIFSRSREWDCVSIPGCPASPSPAMCWRICAPIVVRFEFYMSCRFSGAFSRVAVNLASSGFPWLS